MNRFSYRLNTPHSYSIMNQIDGIRFGTANPCGSPSLAYDRPRHMLDKAHADVMCDLYRNSVAKRPKVDFPSKRSVPNPECDASIIEECLVSLGLNHLIIRGTIVIGRGC